MLSLLHAAFWRLHLNEAALPVRQDNQQVRSASDKAHCLQSRAVTCRAGIVGDVQNHCAAPEDIAQIIHNRFLNYVFRMRAQSSPLAVCVTELHKAKVPPTPLRKKKPG